MHHRFSVRTAGAFVAGLAIASSAIVADAKTTGSKPPAATESQVRARKVLDQMSAFLSTRKEFAVQMMVDYDVLQKNGQKIQFDEYQAVSVKRPGSLRVEKLDSEGKGSLTLFDGTNVLVFDIPANAYATTRQPGGLDQTVIHFVRDLGMRLPLGLLVMDSLPQELDHRVKDLDYVEWTPLPGQPCHHLAGRTPTVDFEIWVADSAEPLPVRIVITYRNQPGMPRFRADFAEWKLDPRFPADEFQFDVPKDARRLPFAVEVAQQIAPVGAKDAGKGVAK